MRARVLLLVLLLCTTSCKRLFSHGDGGSGGLLSTLATLVGFEGEIDMSIDYGASLGGTGAFGAMAIQWKIKGDKMRMEMNMPGLPSSALTGATIIDGSKKKSYTLMPATKEYMEADLDPAKPTTTAPTAKPIVTKTGRKDKVAGYDCDITSITEPGTRSRTELCSSKGLTFLGMGMGPFSKLGEGSGYEEVMKEGFPLRMESYDASGAKIVAMEAKRIEKKSISDSEFEIPSGWKKMTMPSMGGYGTAPPPTYGGGGP